MQWSIPRDANQPKAPSISAVPGTAFVAFAVHNALKNTDTEPNTDFFMETPTDTDRP